MTSFFILLFIVHSCESYCQSAELYNTAIYIAHWFTLC